MNIAFLGLEFLLVSLLLVGAYRLRPHLGLTPVVAVVASLQFFQAILGATFYWEFGPGLLLSPGSCILFASNLAILLYTFARGGVAHARALLYSIIIGNVVASAFSFVLFHHIVSVEPVNFLEISPAIFSTSVASSLLGTLILYLDQLLAVLGYAWLRQRFERLPIPIVMSVILVLVLTFDTVCYLSVLFGSSPDFLEMLASGVISKSLGGLAFGLTWGTYLHFTSNSETASVRQVFDIMLFREDLAELREAAVRDSMTGLFNRRTFDTILGKFVRQEDDFTGVPFCLMLIDADSFKQVNDTLGHATGDEVLRAMAEHLRQATRETDFIFRIGGDEFAIILPECAKAGAAIVGERITGFEFTDPALDGRVSLTVGFSTYPDDADSVGELFELADGRLYAGKSAGKGCVVGADS